MFLHTCENDFLSIHGMVDDSETISLVMGICWTSASLRVHVSYRDKQITVAHRVLALSFCLLSKINMEMTTFSIYYADI